MLFSYSAIVPLCYRSHREVELFSCWWYHTTICNRHWFRECASHESYHGCPVTRTKLNGVNFYFSIWSIDEHIHNVFIMLFDTNSLSTIWPYNQYIWSMDFIKKRPVLFAKGFKV